MNITPAVLINAHHYSYGEDTGREETGENTFTYMRVANKKSVTMRKWRELAAAAITVTNDAQRARDERLTVCKIGPVCQDYWSAAYGIPRGTSNAILAEVRSGQPTDHRHEDRQIEKDCLAVTKDGDSEADIAAEVTLQWWEIWLSLEDQMPNEAAIQHRTVVWQTVYEREYVPDIEWWGISRALSRSRWAALRTVALKNLSIQCFGHVEGNPEEPMVMLSLVQRPKHSNFGMCDKCAEAKDKWVQYRRQA